MLFRVGGGACNVGAVGRVLGKALGKPLGDITRQISVSRGILAETLDAAVVREILPELKSLGLDCLAVPRERLLRFPESGHLREGKFRDAGIRCEVVTWDGWELVERAWSDVLLVSCAQLVSETAKLVDLGSGLIRRREKVLVTVQHRTILDIFVRNPLRHTRILESVPGAEPGAEGVPAHPVSFIRDVARQVLAILPPVPANEGVRLIGAGAASEMLTGVTFTNRHDLEQYNLWLLELVEHGYPIPG